MELMKTHDSPMKIHYRQLHVLLSMEDYSKSVIIYAFHQTSIRIVRIDIFLEKKVICKSMGKYQIIKIGKILKNNLKSTC